MLIQCHECSWGPKGQEMRYLLLRELMWREVLNRLEMSDEVSIGSKEEETYIYRT